MKAVLPHLLKHLWAILITLLTSLLLYLLRGFLNTPTVALVYLVPVLFSTTFWGLSPGLVSGFIAFLMLNYFFILPYYTLQVFHTQDIVALAIFFMVVVITNQLVGRAKRNLEVAEARETEITKLYELSARLVGVNNLPDIAQTLADQSLHTFNAAYVRVTLFSGSGQDALEAIASIEKNQPSGDPQTTLRIQTARGVAGEMRFWREIPLEPPEERLLQTFATQGALALERATLLRLETRAQILEESDHLKSALLSSVSHELRTPLATIKAATTSLLSGEVDWEQIAVREELLAVVDEETDHLNHLVGNLLDMSRIEAGALKPDRQWNMLGEIIEDAQTRMRRTLDNHILRVDLSDNFPLLPVDYHQLKRVFTNLMSNGVKYAPPHTTITIQAEVLETHVRVQVTNQGPPVIPENLPRIFDKFYRVTNADQVTGTGLGLSICKGIIEAHGGRIWAENLPNGFSFIFTLPLTWDGRLPSVIESAIEVEVN